jgi:hypothetical protein
MRRTGTRRAPLRAWLQTFGGGASSVQGFFNFGDSSYDDGGYWGSSSERQIGAEGGTTVGR